jgi:hypothetical protein
VESGANSRNRRATQAGAREIRSRPLLDNMFVCRNPNRYISRSGFRSSSIKNRFSVLVPVFVPEKISGSGLCLYVLKMSDSFFRTYFKFGRSSTSRDRVRLHSVSG